MKSFYEMYQDRYSVRKFSDRAVEPEKLQKILEVARMSPSAHNSQPQHLFVLQSEEALQRLRALCRMAFNAPLVILVCKELSRVPIWTATMSQKWIAERWIAAS